MKAGSKAFRKMTGMRVRGDFPGPKPQDLFRKWNIVKGDVVGYFEKTNINFVFFKRNKGQSNTLEIES